MKEIARETFDLPIYDSPLRYWGLAADYDTEDEPVQDFDETKGNPGESITLVQREGQFKYDNIEAIYKRQGGKSDYYSFEVINPEYNECVFRGSDSQVVPWPVRRALERFGFHDKNTPSSDREFVFDHLLAGVELIREHLDEDELILRSWLNHYISGLTTFAFFTSFENQLPYEDYKKVIEALIEFVDDFRWWYSDTRYSQQIAENVYEELDVPCPIRFPQKDRYAFVPSNKFEDQEFAQKEESSDDSTTFVTLTSGSGESSKYIFATHKSRYAFDRYRFTEVGESEVLLERDDGFDFPPYIVIRALQHHGVKFGNLPTFGPEDSLPEIITAVDEVVRWICKHYEMEHQETIAAYSGYITRLDKVLGLAILLEQDPDTYHRNHETILDKLGLSSIDISSKTMGISGLEDVTGPFIRMFDEETFSVSEEKLEELNIRERGEDFEKMAERFENDPSLIDTINRE